MSTYIGLLRGINVGGRNKLKMADLKDSLAVAGLKNVVTYIQSGNLIFKSAKKSPQLEKLISNTINESFGYDVPVLVRDQSFFETLFASNPYEGEDIKQLYVTILSEVPDRKLVKQAKGNFGGDVFTVKKDVVFLSCPGGYGRTKLTNGYFEKKLGVSATSRNWKSVTKLVEMANAHS